MVDTSGLFFNLPTKIQCICNYFLNIFSDFHSQTIFLKRKNYFETPFNDTGGYRLENITQNVVELCKNEEY